MRPLRIARRMVARARNWGGPHVHCPGCGADCPLPGDDDLRRCFTCRTEWFRHGLSGDDERDLAAIRERVPPGREFTVTLRPVVVDVESGGGGRDSWLLDAAFVYLEDQR